MDRVKITSRNKSVKNCMDCHGILTVHEYNTCRNRCAGCHSKAHNKEYICVDGTNDIYKILQNKIERR